MAMIKRAVQFDSHQKIQLDKRYALGFYRSDGFTARQLKADLLIDWNHDYELYLERYASSGKDQSYFEKQAIPSEMLAGLEKLMSIEMVLKPSYEQVTLEDGGAQLYLLNFRDTTNSIRIADHVPLRHFDTPADKILFDFTVYLKNWVEERYTGWCTGERING